MIVLSGYYLSDDYPTKGGEDLYSSIASDVGLEVDEESYKVLTGQARKAQDEERKEEDVSEISKKIDLILLIRTSDHSQLKMILKAVDIEEFLQAFQENLERF